MPGPRGKDKFLLVKINHNTNSDEEDVKHMGLLWLSKDITSKPHAMKLHVSCIRLPDIMLPDVRILVMCPCLLKEMVVICRKICQFIVKFGYKPQKNLIQIVNHPSIFLFYTMKIKIKIKSDHFNIFPPLLTSGK
jgi:hypothetical protein